MAAPTRVTTRTALGAKTKGPVNLTRMHLGFSMGAEWVPEHRRGPAAMQSNTRARRENRNNLSYSISKYGYGFQNRNAGYQVHWALCCVVRLVANRRYLRGSSPKAFSQKISRGGVADIGGRKRLPSWPDDCAASQPYDHHGRPCIHGQDGVRL